MTPCHIFALIIQIINVNKFFGFFLNPHVLKLPLNVQPSVGGLVTRVYNLRCKG